MIIRKIFNPVSVARYMRAELIISTVLSVAVYFLYHNQHIEKVSLPFSIAAILGSALAIFLAFRNNNAYSRWWEARTVWGGYHQQQSDFCPPNHCQCRQCRCYWQSHPNSGRNL